MAQNNITQIPAHTLFFYFHKKSMFIIFAIYSNIPRKSKNHIPLPEISLTY